MAGLGPGVIRRYHVRVHASVEDEIRAAHLARQRGVVGSDDWAAHRNLLRLKIAALLGLLGSDARVQPEEWALAGMVYLGAAAIAFVLTSRTRDTAGEQSKRNGEPAGFERLRALMSEVEETRRREQGHGTDVALAPDPEGGRAP